jgi:hypothetical protein
MPLPSLVLRETAADAVHRAVCALTGDDGYGHCDLYALAGHALLPAITRLDYMPQVGSFAARVDPPDGWFQICAEEGGMARGEYHCWLGLPGADTGRRDRGVNVYSVGQIVDFGLRHVPAMVARMPQIRRVLHEQESFVVLELTPAPDVIRYTRDVDFPPYLWVEGEPPGDLVYIPDVGAMREFIALNQRRSPLLITLRRHVFEQYARLARDKGLPASRSTTI